MTVTGLAVLLVVLVAATTFGVHRRRTDGRLREHTRGGPDGVSVLTPADLGRELGARATLVQFSSAFCAPCRATRRVLDDVAARVDGVAHVEVDAESNLDLVNRLGVLRTPTVLVLGPAGRVAARASGQPRRADLLAALARIAS